MSDIRSSGQVRVYEIARDLIDKFKIDPEILEEDKHSHCALREYSSEEILADKRLIYPYFLFKISVDPIITNDKFTGALIKDSKSKLSVTYFQWIKNDITKDTAGSFSNFSFDRMLIEGRTYSADDTKKVFEGGSSRLTTARSVLTLVNGPLKNGNPVYINPTVHSISANYYINSGILDIGNGNHRFLAYKLLGFTNFPSNGIAFYNNDPFFNQEHNDLLRELESVFRENGYDIRRTNTKVIDNLLFIANTFKNKELFNFTQEDLKIAPFPYRYTDEEKLELYIKAYNKVKEEREVKEGFWAKFRNRNKKIEIPSEQQGIEERLKVWLTKNKKGD